MNKTRNQIQTEALLESEKYPRSLIFAATGSGKSKVAIDRCKKIVKENPRAKIMLIVPTEKLRDHNWKEEFFKWRAKTIWKRNVKRSCYVSARKYAGKDYDFVILDEVHNITISNSEFFFKNGIHKALGLTATPPEDKEKKQILYRVLGFRVAYTLSLDDSVELGIVAPYEITVIELRLNSTDRYVKSGSKAKPFYQTEAAKYNYLSNTIGRLMFNRTPSGQKTLKFKLFERMRFIYNLRTKTEAAKWILENKILPSLRTLIFCGSIEQAEELCEHTYHSRTNDYDFNLFNEKEINRLSCVRALNEGMNINDLDVGFIVQLNSKKLDLVQRMGRIVRHREGHIGQIYVLCVLDTQDEVWVKKAISGLDESRIKYIRFENLRDEI